MEISHEGYIEGSLGVVNGNVKSRIKRSPAVKREVVSVIALLTCTILSVYFYIQIKVVPRRYNPSSLLLNN